MEEALKSSGWRRLGLAPALAAICAMTVTGAAAGGERRLVLISVDGLRADVITADVAPRMAALRDRGAWAEALNDLPSATLPNHATMLTGLLSDRHHVLFNFFLPGNIAALTIFDYAREAGLRSAFFASKSKLAHLAPPESLEVIDIDADTAALVERMLALLTPDGPELVFLHLRDPDSIGHRFKWLSSEYLDAVTEMDCLIGRIVDALDADSQTESYLIVTADHGGDGVNHFVNIPANRTIPWIVCGPDVAAGRVLDEAVSTADTMPTALWLLGVDVPEGLSGVARFSIRTEITAGIQSSGDAPPPISLPCVILVIPALLGLAIVLRPSRAR